MSDPARYCDLNCGLTRADMVPILASPNRVSEVLRGNKRLSLAMVRRLRARFRVPADLLIPQPKKAPTASRRIGP